MANIIGLIICLLFYIAAGIFSTSKVEEITDGIYQIATGDWEGKAPKWARITVLCFSPLWIIFYPLYLLGCLGYTIYKLHQVKKELEKPAKAIKEHKKALQ